MPPTAEPKVLIVDDEENVAFLVASALRLAGYETLVAGTGTQAVAEVGRFTPDVIVLDIMLPDIDGFEVLRRIRTGGSKAPVLFVTARGATTDRVRGLTGGGDDYIVKPFELEELVARVQVALRHAGIGQPGRRSTRLEVADLAMDLDSRRVWRGEMEAHLTATEFNLLRVLMANAGRVVTREQILDTVWQYDFNGESSIIESFIRNLRRKIDSSEPKLIHTVRGVGYTVREP
ncbi:MAG: response regulator transcription factor [Candidatus Nanopelagicales bacterium]